MKKQMTILFLLAARLFLPAADLYKCQQKPLIDGQEDAAWQGASSWSLQNWRAGQPLLMETKSKIMYDDANLYFFVYCREVNLTEARSQEKFSRHDAPVWNNGCVEFFLDSKNDGRSYHQFVVDVHNDAAELWWYDPAAPLEPVQWNCYWEHAVGTYADGWTVEIAIPFISVHCQPGPIPYLGLNISRVRRIAPFERSVLATEGKHLNSTPHFLPFRNVQRAEPEVSAEIFPAEVYIGSNALRFRVLNHRAEPIEGAIELVGSDNTDARELFRETLKVRLEPGTPIELTTPYQVQIPGNIQLALYFLRDPERQFMQARNFIFRQTLEINELLPICYEGQQQPLYLRTFTDASTRKLRLEIFSLAGQRLAVSELEALPTQGFVKLPTEALPVGEYSVKITFTHNISQSETSLPLRIIPRL